MNKTLKLQILITLIVAILTLTSCNFLDIKSNRSNDNYEKEIIKDKILKSTNISNKKQIKDLVKIGKDYYFVHETKDLIKKLYKYEEDKEVKLLFEHPNMKLYPNDEYLYVHYYESLGYGNKVLYIEDEEIRINANRLDKYTYEFTEDNKIKINDDVIKRDIKIKKNLVYSENNSKK